MKMRGWDIVHCGESVLDSLPREPFRHARTGEPISDIFCCEVFGFVVFYLKALGISNVIRNTR